MFSNALWQQPGTSSYEIDNSVTYSGNETMRRTPSSAGNRATWSYSAWFKRSAISQNHMMFESGASGGYSSRLFHTLNDASNKYELSSGVVNYGLSSTAITDTDTWHHLFIKLASNTHTMYLDGNSVKTTTSITGNTAVNNTGNVHGVFCRGGSGSGSTFKGKVADVLLFDGTAYDPTDVAEDSGGSWIPKDPSDLTFGTNGFWLRMQNSSNFGEDYSGNNNDYTASSFSAGDQSTDTPTS